MFSRAGNKTFPTPAWGLSNGSTIVRAPQNHPKHWLYQRATPQKPGEVVAFRYLPQTSYFETFLLGDKLEPGLWKSVCSQ